MSKRIGIFGGSFNPPHLAHLIAAERAVEELRLDTLLFIPAFIPPHKQHLVLASPEDRLEMLRRAIEGNPCFEISDIELKRQGTSYTIDTLHTIKERYDPEEMVLLIGADNLLIFHTWHRTEEIKQLAKIAVMARPTFDLSSASPDALENVSIVRIPLLEVSSTDIRARVQQGKSIRYLVPDSVLEYMEEHKLYTEEN